MSDKKDNVNHPSHYTVGGIECIEALKAATTGLEGIEAVCTANAIKYLWRWKYKNGVEDLKKAIWYMDRLIQEVENSNKICSSENTCLNCKHSYDDNGALYCKLNKQKE